MAQTTSHAGWDAITAAMRALYPDQTDPIHYAPLVSYQMGGGDPLDGISIYDGGTYYHFVTYGFSELYEKESNDPQWSGCGFELTFRLYKSCIHKREREHKNVCGILQTLGRMVFADGDAFQPEEYIYTGQTTGLDADGSSAITGFLTMLDPDLGEIETPHGKVQFIQLVGATDAELSALNDGALTVADLLKKIGDPVTDYARASTV